MYMNNDFTITVTNQSSGIQELTFDEIDEVSGVNPAGELVKAAAKEF